MNDDSDTYVEVSHGTWGDRIWESLKGIVIGLVLIPVSIALLSWNEEQAVDRSGALAMAADVVISVPAERVSAANEGKLVHVSGRVSTDDVLADPDFGVEVSAIKLVRRVETYQWLETSSSETKDKFGGGTETVTTYKYSKDWSSGLADSSSFKKTGWPPESVRHTIPRHSSSRRQGHARGVRAERSHDRSYGRSATGAASANGGGTSR